MKDKISLSQAFAQWQELAADIPKDDAPAQAESWNDYTDSLAKDGQLGALQYQYCPAHDDEMPGEGSRWDALSEDREFILAAMGVTLEAAFVPFSRSRNAKEKNVSLNWRVTIKKDEREVLETDYMQGCAHCPAYKNPVTFSNGKRDEWATKKAIAYECEGGHVAATYGTPALANFKRGPKIAPPDLADVFHSLMLDASALDCRDFADWCADMGMDSDSIKARGMYGASLAIGLKLRAAFGGKTLEDLSELFEGM